MANKVSKRDLNQLHAAVDEIVAANPETATALATLFTNLLGAASAVAVSGKKGGKKSTKKVSAENDDIDDLDADDEDGDDADEDDADGEDDDDDIEDLETVKPRGKGKAKAKAKQAEEEEEEEEEEAGEDDEDEGIEELTTDAIMSYFNSLEGNGEVHERLGETTGIKELTAMVDELGFDADSVLGKAKSVGEKRAALKGFLSDVHTTIDKIMEFEMDSVLEAIEEIGGEAYTPKGRAKSAKELDAATALFAAAVANEE